MDLGTRPHHVAPRRRRWPLVAVPAAVVAAGVGAATLLLADGGDAAGDAGVVLVAAGARTEDPFLPDLGVPDASPAEPPAPGEVGPPPEAEELDDPVLLAGGQVTGTDTGLYQGTRDQAACDLEGLAEQVAADEPSDLADDWFAALGRHVDDRADYVATLTAVRLRFDTRVTAHAADGAYPAVLQAGTAVLVDRFGVPRVRCAGGDPLTDPEAAPAGVDRAGSLDLGHARDGDAAWDGFDPAAVVVVGGGPTAEAFDLADAAGGEMFTRAVGTDGDRDRGHWTGPAEEDCEGCHGMVIAVETVAGTPARITYEGVDDLMRTATTALVWADGTAAPGRVQTYTVTHDIVGYLPIDPDRPLTDPAYYDDPRYDDEELYVDAVAGVVNECVPGDVTITITVDDVEVQSTTKSVSCALDGATFTFTPG